MSVSNTPASEKRLSGPQSRLKGTVKFESAHDSLMTGSGGHPVPQPRPDVSNAPTSTGAPAAAVFMASAFFPSAPLLAIFVMLFASLSASKNLQLRRYCSSAMALITASSLVALKPPAQLPPKPVSAPSPPHCLSFALSLQNAASDCVVLPVLVLVHVVLLDVPMVLVPTTAPAGQVLLPGALIVTFVLFVVDKHCPCAHFVVPSVVFVVEEPSLLFFVVLVPDPESLGVSLPIGAQIVVPLNCPGA